MKWISVEDELPKNGERVVTIRKHSSTGKLVTDEVYYWEKAGFIKSITHWTPLDPPK